ncbi:MAG: Crp/Fnr family transcriptional regulator [Pseudomonadota bacterium]
MKIQRESNISYISGKKHLGSLATIGWLSEQPEDFKAWVCEVGQLRQYQAGQYVYHANDVAEGVYGLRTGAFEIEFPLVADEPISLVRRTEGFWIGDAGLLSKQTRIVSVLAVEDCSCLMLSSTAIRRLLEREPKHWQSFYDLSHRNIRTAIELLAESLALTVRARVCRRLLELSENRVDAHTTQDALAKSLGVARPTLRRSLASLLELGAIESKYRRIKIVNRDVLEQYKDEQ